MGSPRSLGIPFVRPHFEVRFDVWTRKFLGDERLVTELLGALAEARPESLPVKWGDVEPYRIHVTPSDYRQAVDFWVESSRGYNTIQGFIGTRKKRSGMLVSFACGPRSGQTHCINLYFQKALAGDTESTSKLLARIARQWLGVLEADYARVCLEDEWYKKNVVEQFVEPNGSIDPWMVFNQNITTGMPGVYWMTYFGKIFLDWIGEQFVQNSPWPMVEKVGAGYLLQRSDSACNWSNETTLDDALVDHLGRDRFFNMNEYERPVQAPHFEMPDPYARFREQSGPTIAEASPRKRAGPQRQHKGEQTMSQTPKEEVESLMNEGMPFAQQMLSEHGEFFPFAVVMSPEGKIEHTAVDLGTEAPTSVAVNDQLESVLRQGAAAKCYRAIATFVDRCVERPGDASEIDTVHVALEHQSGYSVNVFFPYARAASGEITFGELFASAREPQFYHWANSNGSGLIDGEPLDGTA